MKYEEEVIYLLKRLNNTVDVLLYRIENVERRLAKDDNIILKSGNLDLTDEIRKGQ